MRSRMRTLDQFAVRPVRNVIAVISPPHWIGFKGSDDDSDAVVWSVKDAGPEPSGWDGMDLYLGPYNPRPGQLVSGFKIVALQSPTTVSFYAQAFDTLPTRGEDALPSPPTIFQRGVVGATLGPGPPGPQSSEGKRRRTRVRGPTSLPNPSN